MLERLARFCTRRRGIVLVAWIAVLFVVSVIANGIVGADYRADMSLPDSESREVQDQLEAASPNRAGFTAQIVFDAEQGVDDPEVRAAMEGLFARVEELDGIDVTNPYTPEGANQISTSAPIAFAELQVADQEYQELIDLGKEVEELGDDVDVDGLTIEYGGEMFAEFEMPESEALGLLAAIIILLIAFGSVVAMGLPIITALFGLGTGVALTVLISNVQSMPDFAPQLTAMIGLGVGIDYALFIVTRYREGLHAGLEPEDATAAAIDTSGRAVLFAGATVIISLHGLVPDGSGVRARPRDRRRTGCARDDGRRGHAAPGVARVRRPSGRGHDATAARSACSSSRSVSCLRSSSGRVCSRWPASQAWPSC